MCAHADLKPANILLCTSTTSPSGVVAKLAVGALWGCALNYIDRTLHGALHAGTSAVGGADSRRDIRTHMPSTSLAVVSLLVLAGLCAGLWSVRALGRGRHTRVQLQLRNTLLRCTRGGGTCAYCFAQHVGCARPSLNAHRGVCMLACVLLCVRHAGCC